MRSMPPDPADQERRRFDLPGLSFEGMSQAVRDGDLVFVSGQVALDANGEVVGVDDGAAQAEQALSNLEAALAAAGSRNEDVVKITCYLRDSADYAAYAAAKNRRFGAAAPAGTCVIVAGLLHPQLLLEVEAIAIVAAAPA
jgi:2-iminobutanoate/2-iminopropanoate deaminase